MNMKKYLKKKNQLKYWKYLINDTEEYQKTYNHVWNIDEVRNYLIEEIKQNELMSKKYEKVCTTLNYIEHFLILALTITGCVSISAFASLIGILIGITSSTIELKSCTITVGVKKYKSIIKKEKESW